MSGDQLGRYVFAWATANAVQTVAYATVVVAAGPRLAKTAINAPRQFTPTMRRAVLSVIALTVLASVGIMSLCEPIFRLAHESIDSTGLQVLGILLVSFVLRSVSDVLWVAAIARKEGRRVAAGMVALAAVGIPSTWWLISRYAGIGVALAHLCSSLLITGWLAWVVRRATHHADSRRRLQTGDGRAA
ncbi:MAG TPA: polysaccharide biosynthesis C-terminal domain-containing protein [Paraburkholderia sp.]